MVVRRALSVGKTVAWYGDVSEDTFGSCQGMALVRKIWNLCRSALHVRRLFQGKDNLGAAEEVMPLIAGYANGYYKNYANLC